MKDLWKPKVENFQRIFSLSFVVEENQRLSGSVWPDCWIICLIFGHLKHWKIAQEHIKFAKVSTKCFQILNEHFQKGQVFNAMPKWQNFAKSGHTTLDLDNFAHAGQSKCRWSAGAGWRGRARCCKGDKKSNSRFGFTMFHSGRKRSLSDARIETRPFTIRTWRSLWTPLLKMFSPSLLPFHSLSFSLFYSHLIRLSLTTCDKEGGDGSKLAGLPVAILIC